MLPPRHKRHDSSCCGRCHSVLGRPFHCYPPQPQGPPTREASCHDQAQSTTAHPVAASLAPWLLPANCPSSFTRRPPCPSWLPSPAAVSIPNLLFPINQGTTPANHSPPFVPIRIASKAGNKTCSALPLPPANAPLPPIPTTLPDHAAHGYRQLDPASKQTRSPRPAFSSRLARPALHSKTRTTRKTTIHIHIHIHNDNTPRHHKHKASPLHRRLPRSRKTVKTSENRRF